MLVETGERSDGRAGRPSRLIDVVPESHYFIGMKVTGGEVLGVATDLRANVLATSSLRLSARDPQTVADAIVELTDLLSRDVPSVTAVGIGIGGRVGDRGIVRSAPFLDWTDVDLGAMLEQRLGMPTVIENDLTAFTAYENWFGAGRDADRFAVLTLGAGVGYGLVVGGEVVVNDDSGIGLVGHWPLDPFGPVCTSGHRGCAQSVLTQSAIVHGVSTALGRSVDYDEALGLAEAGEPAARRVVDDAGRGLGKLLAAIANLTLPELMIVGGEGVRLVKSADAALRESLAEYRDPRASALEIVTTSGDDREWCRGAAVVAIQTYVLGRLR
ncbi:ROK family protein [Salinibacterium sp. ZJ450]|uniref:ROK family protein n=1 Tax=Salinibacterium sp. ZJ450 TaxID=2708338 RepID=UPI001CD33227|nr:ROK family protein [Salinibacterium sp. ZJ450]